MHDNILTNFISSMSRRVLLVLVEVVANVSLAALAMTVLELITVLVDLMITIFGLKAMVVTQ